MKIKRKVVMKQYQKEIEEMYHDDIEL